MILFSVVLTQYSSVADRRTDGRLCYSYKTGHQHSTLGLCWCKNGAWLYRRT